VAELCCHELTGGTAAGAKAWIQVGGWGVGHESAGAIRVKQHLLQHRCSSVEECYSDAFLRRMRQMLLVNERVMTRRGEATNPAG
jgi:hypothetical protein